MYLYICTFSPFLPLPGVLVSHPPSPHCFETFNGDDDDNGDDSNNDGDGDDYVNYGDDDGDGGDDDNDDRDGDDNDDVI
jgi:hypothetical protein